MGSTDFGKFQGFCYEATLPVCNIFNQTGKYCVLEGLQIASTGRNVRNLGSILIAGFAVLITLGLLFLSQRKKAAVGRREIQLFLIGYIVISICEIFTVGGIDALYDTNNNVVLGFTAVHLAAIAATSWILMLNGLVGFQLIDDGTFMSVILVILSAFAVFVGTGYIALDTAFRFTGHFDPSLDSNTGNVNYGLYILYFLLPLICLVVFFVLETFLVLRVLGEKKPMFYLLAAAVLFAAGQVFEFTISRYICVGTGGKIDGALFQTLFTLLSVIAVWTFWNSITEDDWPMPSEGGTGAPYG